MKAYKVGLYSDDDIGNEIVFAENSKEARIKAHKTQIAESQESYIDVYATRYSEFDGMENSSEEEMLYKKFQCGWWFYGLINEAVDELNTDCTFEEFKQALLEKTED